MAGEDSKPAVHAFVCPNCGGQIALRAAGQTVTVVCKHCSAVMDATNEDLRLIQKSKSKSFRSQVIDLGARGSLRGAVWETIGYIERKDVGSGFLWSEYLLFNPQKGFRWLVESDGHWSFVETAKSPPAASTMHLRKLRHLDRTFDLFQAGEASVVFVLGEFYWLVRAGDSVYVQDYVAPPLMLSKEYDKTETIWSMGEYLTALEVRDAFKIATRMPLQIGIAPNQPIGNADGRAAIVGMYFLSILFFLVVQAVSAATATETKVFEQTYDYSPIDVEKTKVSPPFHLDGRTSNVQLKLFGAVTNNWLELQGDLVNDSTGETIELNTGVEFYQGADSDGPWSEGNQFADTVVSSVPSGTYHLNLEPSVGDSTPTNYRVTLHRNVTTWSNFWWGFLLLSLFPVAVLFRTRMIETQRWSQSDFSPYSSGDDE